MNTLTVKLTPGEAAGIIKDFVLSAGMSNSMVHSGANRSPDGHEAILMVFEKYFMRNSSRASLSVMVENLTGVTVVHAAGSGGGQGAILGFDWGASASFSGLVEQAMRPYLT